MVPGPAVARDAVAPEDGVPAPATDRQIMTVTPPGQNGNMSTQLPLFTEPGARGTVGERAVPAAAWVLDEETRTIGRRRAAEARAILRTQRAAADRTARRRAGARPAA